MSARVTGSLLRSVVQGCNRGAIALMQVFELEHLEPRVLPLEHGHNLLEDVLHRREGLAEGDGNLACVVVSHPTLSFNCSQWTEHGLLADRTVKASSDRCAMVTSVSA